MFSGNDDIPIEYARKVVSGNDDVTSVLASYGFWVMMTLKQCPGLRVPHNSYLGHCGIILWRELQRGSRDFELLQGKDISNLFGFCCYRNRLQSLLFWSKLVTKVYRFLD